jgi:murein DD-endopeptidase MepM/ murein hydrolase activator NlpD
MLKMPKLTLTLLAFVLAALPVIASAKNIYKYQDEDGIWHFTDRAPHDETEFETVYMEREPEPRVRIRQEGTKHSPVYLVFNDFWGPVEVELKLKDDINVLSEPPLPARFVIPGQKEQVLVGIGALNPKMSFQFRLGMVTVPGKPIPEPITGLEILPPIAPDEAYTVSQGFLGEKTHNTPESKYAIDIAMPVGTAIHAVRSGIVMDVEEDFNKGGTDRNKFVDKANHVRIVHPDGTMALYAHLDLASVIVRPGTRVRAGQKIASSGNTGFSSGPHLHFAIQQNTGLNLISLPFRFKTPDGATVEPEKLQVVRGTSYTP